MSRKNREDVKRLASGGCFGQWKTIKKVKKKRKMKGSDRLWAEDWELAEEREKWPFVKRHMVLRKDSGCAGDAEAAEYVESRHEEYNLTKGKGPGKNNNPGVEYLNIDTCCIYVVSTSKQNMRSSYIGSREDVYRCLRDASKGRPTHVVHTEYAREMSGREGDCFERLLEAMNDGKSGTVDSMFRRIILPSVEIQTKSGECTVSEDGGVSLDVTVESWGERTYSSLLEELAGRSRSKRRGTVAENLQSNYEDLLTFSYATAASLIALTSGGANKGTLTPTQMAHTLMFLWTQEEAGLDPEVVEASIVFFHKNGWEWGQFEPVKYAMSKTPLAKKEGLAIFANFQRFVSADEEVQCVAEAIRYYMFNGDSSGDGEECVRIMDTILSYCKRAALCYSQEVNTIRQRALKGIAPTCVSPIEDMNTAYKAVVKYMGPMGYTLLETEGVVGSPYDAFFAPIPYHMMHISLKHVSEEIGGGEWSFSPRAYPVCNGGCIVFVPQGYTEVFRCVLFYLFQRTSGSRSSAEVPAYPVVCAWLIPTLRRMAKIIVSRYVEEGEMKETLDPFFKACSQRLSAKSALLPPLTQIVRLCTGFTTQERMMLMVAMRTLSWWFQSNKSSKLLRSMGTLDNGSFEACFTLLVKLVEFWPTEVEQSQEWSLWQLAGRDVDLSTGEISPVVGEEEKAPPPPTGRRKRKAPLGDVFATSPMMEIVRSATHLNANMEMTGGVHTEILGYLKRKHIGDDRGIVKYLLSRERSPLCVEGSAREDVIPLIVPPRTLKDMWDSLLSPSNVKDDYLSSRILFRTQAEDRIELLERSSPKFSTDIECVYKGMYPELFSAGESDETLTYTKQAFVEMMLSGEGGYGVPSRGALLARPSLGSHSIGLHEPWRSQEHQLNSLRYISHLLEKRPFPPDYWDGSVCVEPVVKGRRRRKKARLVGRTLSLFCKGRSSTSSSPSLEDSLCEEDTEEEDTCDGFIVGESGSDGNECVAFDLGYVSSEDSDEASEEPLAIQEPVAEDPSTTTFYPEPCEEYPNGENLSRQDILEKVLFEAIAEPVVAIFRMLEKSGCKEDRERPLSHGLSLPFATIADPDKDFPVLIDKVTDQTVTYRQSFCLFRTHPSYQRLFGDSVDTHILPDLIDFWSEKKALGKKPH
jgi:hypothetical protein